MRAAGFDVVRYAAPSIDAVTPGVPCAPVSWEDALVDRNSGFVLQADCVFVI